MAWSGAIAWVGSRTPQRCCYCQATLVPDPFFIVIESLGRSYQVIAPAYPPVRSMAELVAGVTAILDAEGIPTAHVVGSSFGGYLAQCLVRAHPERVKMLVLAQTGYAISSAWRHLQSSGGCCRHHRLRSCAGSCGARGECSPT